MPHRRKLRVPAAGDGGMQPALRALGAELAAAQETALDLQVAVGEVLASLAGGGGDAIFRLQDLDRLAQTLGDLSRFAEAAARAAPEAWPFDVRAATSALRLRALAGRLAGDAPRGAPDADDDFLLD